MSQKKKQIDPKTRDALYNLFKMVRDNSKNTDDVLKAYEYMKELRPDLCRHKPDGVKAFEDMFEEMFGKDMFSG